MVRYLYIGQQGKLSYESFAVIVHMFLFCSVTEWNLLAADVI